MNTGIVYLVLSIGSAYAELPVTEAPIAEIRSEIAKVQEKLAPRAGTEHLFAVVQVKDKRAIQLKQSQLERPFLMSVTLEQGTGELGVYSTMMDDSFLMAFHWKGDKLQAVRLDPTERADPGSPESRAVERSFSSSIIASLPVLASSTVDGTFTFAAEAFFLTDLTYVQGALKHSYPSPDLRLSPPDSTLEKLVSFPRNLEAGAQLVFVRNDPTPSQLPDPRRLSLRVRTSLSELPAPGFEPRSPDARVGYFQTTYRDYSRPELRDKIQPAVHLIHRWRLEKKEPAVPVSEPKKPIVFWLEDSVPEEHRPALRAGILAWNAAFEAIGVRNALVVKEVDKDMTPEERSSFDPADASYNVIRWFMGKGGPGFAIGPSRVNPLTGEIYNATVSLSDTMTRFLGDESQLGAVRPRPSGAESRGHDGWLDAALADAEAGLALLESRDALSPVERKRYKDEFLAHIIAHEIGHNLGLRHNFKATSVIARSELGKDGLVTSSVMDYVPVHIAPKGQPQGPYYQAKVGPYDFWAVEYGYKPLSGDSDAQARERKRIAARSGTDTRLLYGTDEDADDFDPDALRHDLGHGPIAFGRDRTALAKELWANLAARQDTRPNELRRGFQIGAGQYFLGARTVLPLIGGIRVSRQPAPDAYVPVSAKEQREALHFLAETAFSREAFAVPPSLLRRMGQDRLDRAYRSDAPVSVAAMASALQDMVLGELFEQHRLRRLAERESLLGDGKDPFGPRDMIETVRQAIWAEVEGKPSNIVSVRRELQRKHLGRVTALLVDEAAPGDARAAARGDIRALDNRLRTALKSKKLDADTRLHLQQMRNAIKNTFDNKPSV